LFFEVPVQGWTTVEERPFYGRVGRILTMNAALKGPLFHGDPQSKKLDRNKKGGQLAAFS